MLLGGCLGCGVKAPAGTGPITLRLKPKVGSRFVYEVTRQIEFVGESRGPQRTVITNSTAVQESGEKSVKLVSTVEKVDSQTAEDQGMVGVKMFFTFSPRYEPLNVRVEGGGKDVQQMAKAIAAAFKIAPAFSDKSVRPGDSWSIPIDIGLILSEASGGLISVKGNRTMDLTMKFEKVGSVSGRPAAHVLTSGAGGYTLVSGGQDVKMNWTLDGSTDFDIETGMSLAATMNQHQEMKSPTGDTNTLIKNVTVLKSMK